MTYSAVPARMIVGNGQKPPRVSAHRDKYRKWQLGLAITFVLSLCYFQMSFLIRGLTDVLFGNDIWLKIAVNIPIYCAAAVYLARRNRIALSPTVLALMLFIGFAGLSVIWSSARADTAVAFTGLVGSALFGFWLVNRLGGRVPELIWRATFWYCAVSLVLYAANVPLVKYTGTAWHKELALQGAAGHKNIFGGMAAMSVIILYSRWRALRVRSAIPLAVVALGLLLSRAATSDFAVVITIGYVELLLFSFHSRHPRAVLIFGTLSLTLIALLLFSPSWQSVVTSVGRDDTLSSRTKIWAIVLEVFEKHLFFGTGYGALWADTGYASGEAQRAFYGTTFRQAHNGYLQLAAEQGIFGLIVGLAVIGVIFNALAKRCIVDRNAVPFMAILILMLCINLGEANLFIGNYISFSMLCACAGYVSLKPMRRRVSSPVVAANGRENLQVRASPATV